MCLNKAVRIKPEKDIVCYKLFYKRDSDNTLYSLYKGSPYKLNNTKNTRKSKPNLYCFEFLGEKTYDVFESALHSFANYEDTKFFKEDAGIFKNIKSIKSIIVKCIIPKSSEYIYEGTFRGVKAYASQKLKPIEILN